MEGGIEVLEAAVPLLEAARRSVENTYRTADDAFVLQKLKTEWPTIENALKRARGEPEAATLVKKTDALARRVDVTNIESMIPRGTLPPAPTETRLDESEGNGGSQLPFAIVAVALFLATMASQIWLLLIPLVAVMLLWRGMRLDNKQPKRWVMLPDRLHFEGRDYATSRLRVISHTPELVIVSAGGENHMLSTLDGPKLAATITLLNDSWLHNLESRPAPHSIDGNTLEVAEGRLTVENAPIDMKSYLFLLAHVPGPRWKVLGPHLGGWEAK